MITRLAVSGYRSLRDIKMPLGALTVITGANGTGKSSVYRSLRLLSDIAQGRLTASLAAEGGLHSTLWAGPERINNDMRAGRAPITGTKRRNPISLRLGFAGDDFGYAIDLGLPTPGSPFEFDPEISRSNAFAERRNRMIRLRQASTGDWRMSLEDLHPFESMVTHSANREDGLELLMMRERMRNWRFYDTLRTDLDAPSRRPQVVTYTPALANDGADLGGAITTLLTIGDGATLVASIDDAFPGSNLRVGSDGTVEMQQRGLLRALRASELSDGTLRYILLCAALLAPSNPEILVLNEPESSLHPSLLDALARLLLKAAESCQIVVVSHSDRLVAALSGSMTTRTFGPSVGKRTAAKLRCMGRTMTIFDGTGRRASRSVQLVAQLIAQHRDQSVN